MGTLVPNATFAGPTEPIWAYANSGSSATGPTGMKGATGFTGYTGPAGSSPALFQIDPIIIPANSVITLALKSQLVGTLVAITSDGSGDVGVYEINLTGPDTFPTNATFFLKNVDTTANPQIITVSYNGELRGFLYPPAPGANNGFLCICQITAGNVLNIF